MQPLVAASIVVGHWQRFAQSGVQLRIGISAFVGNIYCQRIIELPIAHVFPHQPQTGAAVVAPVAFVASELVGEESACVASAQSKAEAEIVGRSAVESSRGAQSAAVASVDADASPCVIEW